MDQSTTGLCQTFHTLTMSSSRVRLDSRTVDSATSEHKASDERTLGAESV